jgi:DNA repair protein RadC
MTARAVVRVPRYRCKLVREGTVTYPVAKAVDAAAVASIVAHRLLDDADREKIAVLYTDCKLGIVGTEIVAVGGGSDCQVAPADIVRGAVLARAHGIILAHNHPSGDPMPSDEDRALTVAVGRAAELLGLTLLDHVIIGPYGKTYSFHEHALQLK